MGSKKLASARNTTQICRRSACASRSKDNRSDGKQKKKKSSEKAGLMILDPNYHGFAVAVEGPEEWSKMWHRFL